MENLKLIIELVPEPLWGFSLANMSKDWDSLRKELYRASGYSCQICGRGSKELDEGERYEAHEIWEYDDNKHIQKLTGLICLCSKCHKVKHMGRSKKTLTEEEIEKLNEHFCKVNKCDVGTLKDHEEEIFKLWKERSEHEWQRDLGHYSKYFK